MATRRFCRSGTSLRDTTELQKSIGELADSVRLSERTLQRRFHRATRLKLTEYLQNVRIMKARQLLKQRTAPSGALPGRLAIPIRRISKNLRQVDGRETSIAVTRGFDRVKDVADR